MKTKNILRNIAVVAALSVAATGCTNLDEELYGRLTPDNYYQTEEQALASLAG